MDTIYVLIMILEGSRGVAIHTQEFSSEAYCNMAKQQYENINPSSWKDYKAICVRK